MKLGCGILFQYLDNHDNILHEYNRCYRVECSTPSSTAAELYAIALSLESKLNPPIIHIFTDSLCAIQAIKSRNYWDMNYICDTIQGQIEKNQLSVNFTKVKGHSGIPENEFVDGLAKDALSLPKVTPLRYSSNPGKFYFWSGNRNIIGNLPPMIQHGLTNNALIKSHKKEKIEPFFNSLPQDKE